MVQITHPSDHISNLPDDVLSHILSRLDIKDAIKTCVLSKDWEFKWTLIYNVRMFLPDLKIDTAEKVLHHIQNIQKIEHFDLFCKEDMGAQYIILLFAIIRRNIKSIRFEVYSYGTLFPHVFPNSTSLTKLVLKFGRLCSFTFPVKNHFPNLESLSLGNVEMLPESSNTDMLIFTFPTLKVLKLSMCKWLNAKCVEFHTPSLCEFESIIPSWYDDKKNFEYTIKFIGARLAKFYAHSSYPENIIMIDSTVSSAKLIYQIFEQSAISVGELGLQLRKLLTEISNVRHLSMEYVLSVIGQSKQGVPLPRFSELNELLLCPDLDFEGVLELLDAAPFLKILSIFMRYKKGHGCDFVEPIVPPSCVAHHLEEVTLYYYRKCLERNFLFEKFLLKNGAQLKTVFIKSYFKEVQLNRIVDKLLKFRKASSCLEIVSCSTE